MATEYILNSNDYSKPWTKLAKSPELSKLILLQTLNRSAYGKRIIKAAKQKAAHTGRTLVDIIILGKGSITDTTLIRRFSRSNPEQVEYMDKSKVYINSELSVHDAVLDLAHELTHFSFRTTFNPYKSGFNFKSFLQETIEKRGGEVDAFLTECHVMKDLFSGYKSGKGVKMCSQVRDLATGKLSKKIAITKFYQVGPLFAKFWEDSQQFGISKVDFPWLSSEQSLFISSAYSLPYPLATIIEYRSMMSRACRNDETRMALMKKKVGRVPASVVKKSFKVMEKSFFERCQNIAY